MSDRPHTPFLDRVNSPADIRRFKKAELPQLADELRQEMISAVSTSGGHLGSGLGVVELTVAIHHVFNTPEDILIWDVGHQCYPHKIVTGRRDRIRTLRQGGGLSGFTKRSESEYDPFGAAHSSTSISAALGFAISNKLSNRTAGLLRQLVGDGKAERGGNRRRAVRRAERVIFAFAALGETRQALRLPQRPDAIATPRENLVRIGLMADIPDQAIAGRIEDVVNGRGQLDHAEAGAEVTAGHRDRVDGLLTELVGDLLHLLDLELAQVVRRFDRVEKRRLTIFGHSDIPVLHVGKRSDEKRGCA